MTGEFIVKENFIDGAKINRVGVLENHLEGYTQLGATLFWEKQNNCVRI